jgi:hypothetical protein
MSRRTATLEYAFENRGGRKSTVKGNDTLNEKVNDGTNRNITFRRDGFPRESDHEADISKDPK